MDKRILSYIKKKQLLTWAMQDEIGVYIANAFYAFDDAEFVFIISSHEDTKHIQLAFKNPYVAVNIAKETKIKLIEGVQIKAYFQKANENQEKLYFEKFPFANLAKAQIYALRIDYVKYTNNKLILPKKLEFIREN